MGALIIILGLGAPLARYFPIILTGGLVPFRLPWCASPSSVHAHALLEVAAVRTRGGVTARVTMKQRPILRYIEIGI